VGGAASGVSSCARTRESVSEAVLSVDWRRKRHVP
jgi:hypothetical protein